MATTFLKRMFQDKKSKRQETFALLDERKSPLSRIMSIYDLDNLPRRAFENNICSFHIGKGLILSVAHNLCNPNQFLRAIDESEFQSRIIRNAQPADQIYLQQKYQLDVSRKRRYPTFGDNEIPNVFAALQRVGFDSRYPALYQTSVCKPYLVFNFKEDSFLDGKYDQHFDSTTRFFEADIARYTFLVELELLEIDYPVDYSIYRIHPRYVGLGDELPSVSVSYEIFGPDFSDLFCLQGAPVNNLGRTLNTASIEGYLDQFSPMGVYNGKNFHFEGFRYLIKGYFRFGSSGAPYVYYDTKKQMFMVNAIQSEACGLQLMIGNSRDGHQQYINAIASPLTNAKPLIERHRGKQ